MTEQQDAPPLSDEQDTEGHLAMRQVPEEEDTEGHLAARQLPEEDDDVEGHRTTRGSAVQPGHDDDDVAGHLRAF